MYRYIICDSHDAPQNHSDLKQIIYFLSVCEDYDKMLWLVDMIGM